jgi:hypothetical protein
MAETFEDYVRSGGLQKNFDEAVAKAAEEAKRRGLRRFVRTTEAESDAAKTASADEPTALPSKSGEQ